MNLIDYLKGILKGWELSTLNFLPRLILAIITLLLFLLLARIGKKISLRFYSRVIKSNSDIAKIIAAIIYFFLLISGVFIALEILGLEQVLTKLLAGAGIVGIVAGFAFKDIASNAFSGLLLSIQRPFKVGDWVAMDGTYGTVLKISWLTTAIENTTGQEVFVPNQIIYSNTFTNFTTFGKRRIVINGSVPLSCDMENVRSIVLNETSQMPGLLQKSAVDFYYTDITGTSLSFELSFWIGFTAEVDHQKERSEAIIRIKKRLEDEKIPLS